MRRLVLGLLVVVVTAGCLSLTSPSSSDSRDPGGVEIPDAQALVDSSVEKLESVEGYSLRHTSRLSTPRRLTTRTTSGEVSFSEGTADLRVETSTGTGNRDAVTRINVSNSTVYTDGETVDRVEGLRRYLSDAEGLRIDYYPVSSLGAIADSPNVSVTTTTYEGEDAYRVSSTVSPNETRIDSETAEVTAVIDAETRLPTEIRYTVSEGGSEATETLRLSYPRD